MIDISKIHVGDVVRSKVEKHGGKYEPNCILRVGELTNVTEVHDNHIIVGDYCGFVLMPDEADYAEEPKKRTPSGIMSPFNNDRTYTACSSTIEGTMTVKFKTQSVTIRDLISALTKLPDRAYLHDIECSMFDHANEGPLTVVTVRYRIDEKGMSSVAVREFDAGTLTGTAPCEIINRQGT